MQISVSDAKALLTDLVRRAEQGDEVILTRHGHPAVRIVPVQAVPDLVERRRVMDEIYAQAVTTPGPSAARSQDFLYDEDGLPR